MLFELMKNMSSVKTGFTQVLSVAALAYYLLKRGKWYSFHQQF